MTTIDTTDTWSQPVPSPIRRRASAQYRLRKEAELLDSLDAKSGIPVKRDPDDARPTLTAAQLRMVADLLDLPGWGQQ